MRISQRGLDLIKRYEGYRDTAYVCPAGVMTIGYGTTRINGNPVKRGMRCTKEQAQGWLEDDVNDFLASADRLISEDVKLNQNQVDSIASFVYNIGIGNFKKSTLLQHLNDGFLVLAANEFARWNKGGGRVLKGLTERREAEAELFMEGMGTQPNKDLKSEPDRSNNSNSFLGQ